MAARIAVVGGSVAGLSSAILLARRGFEVDLYERDTPPPDDLDDVQQWNRPGAPQTQHPHVFLGLFRKLLRQNLPDVHEDMLAGGVEELPFSCPLAATAPGDEDLLMMAARRTTLEWALHRARGRESRIRYCPGASVQLGDVDNGTLKGFAPPRATATTTPSSTPPVRARSSAWRSRRSSPTSSAARSTTAASTSCGTAPSARRCSTARSASWTDSVTARRFSTTTAGRSRSTSAGCPRTTP
ncbi:NAD(P)-binding protein [Saccharopolyspora spinosporotrichia]